MMLNFLSHDTVIRRCTVLCIMNACMPPLCSKVQLVDRVFDALWLKENQYRCVQFVISGFVLVPAEIVAFSLCLHRCHLT